MSDKSASRSPGLARKMLTIRRTFATSRRRIHGGRFPWKLSRVVDDARRVGSRIRVRSSRVAVHRRPRAQPCRFLRIA